jgi:hypothetical protein
MAALTLALGTGGVAAPTSPFNRRSIVQYAVVWLKQ